MNGRPSGDRPPRLTRLILRLFLDETQLEELDELFAQRIERVGRRAAGRAYLFELWWGFRAWIAKSAGAGRGPGRSEDRSFRSLAPCFTQDVGFSLRHAMRHPATVAMTIIMLALGIGTSSAMFSVVDSVLIRSLPYPEPEQLVSVHMTNPDWLGHELWGNRWNRFEFSHMEYEAWRGVQTSFSMAAAIGRGSARLSGTGDPERLMVGAATWELFPMLGATPMLGRLFNAQDDNRSGERIVLVSAGFWRRRLGADPLAVGRILQLTGESHTIVGVLPDGFQVDGVQTELWTPIGVHASPMAWHNHTLQVIARLADGVALERAQAETEQLLASLVLSPPCDTEHGANVVPRLLDRTRTARTPILILLGSSLVLLIIACVNASAMLLGMGMEREGEFSVRGALGAARHRLVRQLLTESLVMTALAGLLGVLIAWIAVDLIVYLAPPGLPRIENATLDLRALFFALVVSTVTGVASGLVPAISLTRSDLASLIRRVRAQGRSRTRLMAAMVVGELALATVLLVGAGLLTRTLVRLNAVDPGFRAEGLISVSVSPDAQLLRANGGHAEGYLSAIRGGLSSLPGVRQVGTTTTLPLGPVNGGPVTLEDYKPPEGEGGLSAQILVVSHEYLHLMGVEAAEGRGFTAGDDRADAAPVVLVNRELAAQAWKGESPLGKRLSFWGGDFTIVGMVENLKTRSLSEEATPQYYVPQGKMWDRYPPQHFVLAVDADVGQVLPLVRDRIWSVAPDLPVTRVTPVEELLSSTLGEQRYRARMMLTFAGLAIFMALLGVYGIAAHFVAFRNREVAIRMALGASRSQVMSMVLCRGAGVAALGLGLGMILSLAVTRVLVGFFAGTEANDPLTLLVVATSAGLMSLLANLPASIRATRADPMTTLREE